MQVQIKGEIKQLYVQTITLQPEESENLYAFHCLTCGNFHQKIGGKVSKVYPWVEPSGQVPSVSKCRNCGSEYTFQTHDGYSSEKIKVILHPVESKEMNHFYCYKGKDLLLSYTLLSIYSHVEEKKKRVPFFSKCANIDCSLIYYINDIL